MDNDASVDVRNPIDLISSITKSASLGENANVILCINFLKSAFPNEKS